MLNIRNEVAVVGTGWSEVSRHSEKNLSQLVVQACGRALDDAGLTWDQVDGIATYPSTAGSGGSQEGVDSVGIAYFARTMGLRHLRWYISLDKGTIGHVLVAVINAVAAGACDHALVWKAMHAPQGAFGRFASSSAPGDSQFTAPYGLANAVATFALPYSRYMSLYGMTREHMATFIVNNRKMTNLNPDAVFYTKPITRDDYLNDKVVADPISVLDCDMPVDGAGAMVLTRADRAKDLKQKPAFVIGYSNSGNDYAGAPVMTLDGFRENSDQGAKVLWENTGLGPKDVDMVSLYDGFSYFPLFWLESLGFCKKGEAFEWIQGGRIELGGELPLNTGGGALGMGRLHGMPQLIEAVRQVQGVAGPRQVEGCEVALAHVGSAIHGSGLILFGKEADI